MREIGQVRKCCCKCYWNDQCCDGCMWEIKSCDNFTPVAEEDWDYIVEKEYNIAFDERAEEYNELLSEMEGDA